MSMTDEQDTEAVLRQRLRDDAENVLAEELTRHAERMLRIVRFRMHPLVAARVDAEDILQEAWLAARQRVDSFLEGDEMPLFLWLRLIVNQTLVDVHRRHLGAKKRDAFREVDLPAAGPVGTSASMALQLAGSRTSPSQAIARDEVAAQLQAAIETMDTIDREVLALRHFEELSNSEVANVLNIQPKAASIRYVRAVRRLKVILEQHADFGSASER